MKQLAKHAAQIEDIIAASKIGYAYAEQTAVLFVSNIRSGPPRDVGDSGLLQLAQYYTEAQFTEIVTTLQQIGFTVIPFPSEKALIHFLATGGLGRRPPRFVLTYTTAEGGEGAGRRALVPLLSNLYGVPCCNSGAYGSAIGRHKFSSNLLARSSGVSVPESWYFMRDAQWLGDRRPGVGLKVIVKPTYESAAIGISYRSVVRVDAFFDEFCHAALDLWRQPVTVQEFRSGYEVGVPIAQFPEEMAMRPVGFSPAKGDERRFGGRFRTFEEENLSGPRVFFDPGEVLEDSVIHAMMRDAIRAFRALELEGVGRIDMRVDEDGKWYAFDMNESPPPVYNSSLGFSLKMMGLSYEDMLAFLLGVNLRLRFGLVTPSV